MSLGKYVVALLDFADEPLVTSGPIGIPDMFVFGSFMSNVQYQEIENRCLMVLFDLLRR